MLKNLHIENIAVIEKTDIAFELGFNALTGETGAGKSIVIDAINAVLGERTSKELIRSGCEKAEVSALFGSLSAYTEKALKDCGFEADEDGNLLISRVLNINGGGTVRINGKPATVGILKTIGKTLVNIHGQHDNQGLLNPENHIIYIDRIAENDNLSEEYYLEFKKLNAIRRELNAEELDEDEKQKQAEFLKYQIEELSAADIKLGELDELRRRLDSVAALEKNIASLNTVQALLHGTDDSDGALSMMKEAQKNLLSVKLPEFDEITRRLSDALSQTEEVCSEVRRFAENSDFSENEIEKIRIRLDLLRRLMLKYGDSEEKLLDSLESAQRNLEKIILSDKRITELSAALDKSTETLIALADKLSASRKSAALNFADKVTQVLHYLDIPNALFEVNISMGRYTKTGCDNIEFLIRTNAGEEKKPLHKIASGGELSRVMLAIKSVLADNDDVDTLIFDEIDAGISGRAAGKVGVQLKCVSKSRQVICVTHLAQIAAFATKHLLIEKNVNQNRTFTNVKPLDGEGRITEIARIMSGTEMTKNLYNSAKELLDRSQNHENL